MGEPRDSQIHVYDLVTPGVLKLFKLHQPIQILYVQFEVYEQLLVELCSFLYCQQGADGKDSRENLTLNLNVKFVYKFLYIC